MRLLLEQVCAQRAVERGALAALCDAALRGDLTRLTECPRVAGLFVGGARRLLAADFRDLETRVRALVSTLLRKHAELFLEPADESAEPGSAAPKKKRRAALPAPPPPPLALEAAPAADDEPLQIALTTKGTRRLCLTHDMSWLADPAYASSLLQTDELFRKEFSQRVEAPDLGLLERGVPDDVTMMFEEEDISSMLRDDRSSERAGFCTQQSDLARQILNQLDENTDYERLRTNMPTTTPLRPVDFTPLPPKSTIVRMHERSALVLPADEAPPGPGAAAKAPRRKSEARRKAPPTLLQYGRLVEGDAEINVAGPASFEAVRKRVWKPCRAVGLNPACWSGLVVSSAGADSLFHLPPVDLIELFLHRELLASSVLARDDPHLREEFEEEPPVAAPGTVVHQYERPTPIAQATPSGRLSVIEPSESVAFSSRRRTPTFAAELPLVPVNGGVLSSKAAYLNAVLHKLFEKRAGEPVEWTKLLPADAKRWQAAVCFANLLHLLAQGLIAAAQPRPFAPITLAPLLRKRTCDDENTHPDHFKRIRTPKTPR